MPVFQRLLLLFCVKFFFSFIKGNLLLLFCVSIGYLYVYVFRIWACALAEGEVLWRVVQWGVGDQSVHLATTSYAGTRAIMEVD